MRLQRALVVPGSVGAALVLALSGSAAAAPQTVGSPASLTVQPADIGGLIPFDGHPVNIRNGPGTSYSIIDTVQPGDTRVCVDTGHCDEGRTGSSYTCWPGGPTGNLWTPVRTNKNKEGWVAHYCSGWGRVG